MINMKNINAKLCLFLIFIFCCAIPCFSSPPPWLEQGKYFKYHGYGSSGSGAAATIMTYTVLSSSASGAQAQRSTYEESFGIPLENTTISFSSTDKAGEFWLDISVLSGLKAKDKVPIKTAAGNFEMAYFGSAPLDLGDPQYGTKSYKNVAIFELDLVGTDSTTNGTYYFNGENGALISYSEYLYKGTEKLSSVIIYLVETDADFTKLPQTTVNNGGWPGYSGKEICCCPVVLLILLGAFFVRVKE